MAIPTGAATAAEAFKERMAPVADKFEETMRKGRKAMMRGQNAAEDCAANAALEIRRHPLSAVVTAAGIGALVGALVGFGLGRVNWHRE